MFCRRTARRSLIRTIMNVTAVPMLKDNLGYLVTCQSTGAHFFVDISHHSAAKFIAACEQHDALKPGLTVFTTHKHSDHAGGNEEARLLFQKRTGASLIVYGDSGIDKTPGISRGINDGESVTIGDLTVRAIQTPCHTRGSMCYHVISKDPSHPGCMFTGDTLFPGGVGYFFEGNSADMVAAIRKILSSVKHPQTQFFAGHDYAMQFYPEAAKRDPSNTFIAEKLRWAESMKAQQLPAMPTTLQDELETNLFVQCVTNMPQVGKRYPGWDPATGPVGLMELVYNSF